MRGRVLIMVFLKAPRTGTVKTRLGREIGMEAATAIYRELAETQVGRLPAEFQSEVHYAPRGAALEMRRWLGDRVSLRAQCSGDLGSRLAHAFGRGFARGHRRILAIGADCPQLDADTLRGAASRLEETDVVLGPATDGGYYLIGLRRFEPRLFEDVAWGSSSVCATTLGRVRESGLSHSLLAARDDVDDLASLNKAFPLRAGMSGPTSTAPETSSSTSP